MQIEERQHGTQADAHILSDKVAVVTGAGRGIGRAIAVGLGGAGARVCCAARTESEIAGTAAQIQQLGGQAIARSTDVTHWDAVRALFESASAAFGGVDIVVINAGISTPKTPVEESNPAEWIRTLEVNLIGAYYTAKAAIPHLRKRGAGKIIFIGSGLGHRGIPERSSYACSKAGVWMLTRVLAQELHSYGISVNELIPGPVRTALAPQSEEDFLAELGGSEWVKRPKDVVPLALFLATQPAPGPTAQSFSLMRRNG